LRITPQGAVTPCPYIPESVGDLRTQSLRAIWEESAALQRLRTEMPGGKCGACDYRLSCGGCRARAYATCGDMMDEDPKCPYLPPFGATPEVPSKSADDEVRWSDEARTRLARIPAFLRTTVRKRLEARAREQGLSVITTEFMQAHRPHDISRMPFRRPASP
jgi:radical SAM protein with 4Fe4S-binding SPASM domain